MGNTLRGGCAAACAAGAAARGAGAGATPASPPPWAPLGESITIFEAAAGALAAPALPPVGVDVEAGADEVEEKKEEKKGSLGACCWCCLRGEAGLAAPLAVPAVAPACCKVSVGCRMPVPAAPPQPPKDGGRRGC